MNQAELDTDYPNRDELGNILSRDDYEKLCELFRSFRTIDYKRINNSLLRKQLEEIIDTTSKLIDILANGVAVVGHIAGHISDDEIWVNRSKGDPLGTAFTKVVRITHDITWLREQAKGTLSELPKSLGGRPKTYIFRAVFLSSWTDLRTRDRQTSDSDERSKQL